MLKTLRDWTLWGVDLHHILGLVMTFRPTFISIARYKAIAYSASDLRVILKIWIWNLINLKFWILMIPLGRSSSVISEYTLFHIKNYLFIYKNQCLGEILTACAQYERVGWPCGQSPSSSLWISLYLAFIIFLMQHAAVSYKMLDVITNIKKLNVSYVSHKMLKLRNFPCSCLREPIRKPHSLNLAFNWFPPTVAANSRNHKSI